MSARRRIAGFTIVEAVMALFVLSVIALALTSTLVSTQRAGMISAHWMQATQLAAEGIERLRAGAAPAAGQVGDFERTSKRTACGAHPGLSRLEVTVAWNDGEQHQFVLTTLAR